MTDKRYGHYSILLQDGRVLIGGGAATGGSGSYATYHSSAEIFDPETGSSRATASMSTARMGDKGTLLPDGRGCICKRDSAYPCYDLPGGNIRSTNRRIYGNSIQSRIRKNLQVYATFKWKDSCIRSIRRDHDNRSGNGRV